MKAAEEISRGKKLANELNINEEHSDNMEEVIKYMETHRI